MNQNLRTNLNLEKIFGAPLDSILNIIQNKQYNINRFFIKKKSGGYREIIAPKPNFKNILRNLNSTFFRYYTAHESANGFIFKRNIVTNVIPHIGRKSIGHVDIDNFFGSITKNMVIKSLLGNVNICRYCIHAYRRQNGECHSGIYQNSKIDYIYKCDEVKAFVLPDYCKDTGYTSGFDMIAEFCTYNGVLPQGFPCSPYISNIIMYGFDKHISEFAKSKNCYYSRYADDIAVSSDELTAEQLRNEMLPQIIKTLWAIGLKLNKKKMVWKDKGRKMICGIVVNVKPNIKRATARIFRAMVHHATVKNKLVKIKRIRSLLGFASYFTYVNPQIGIKYYRQLSKALTNHHHENSNYAKEDRCQTSHTKFTPTGPV